MDPFTAAALLGLITTVIGTGGKLTNTAMQQKLANMKAENRAPGAPGGGALPRTGEETASSLPALIAAMEEKAEEEKNRSLNPADDAQLEGVDYA